jgi:hypothetical protein
MNSLGKYEDSFDLGFDIAMPFSFLGQTCGREDRAQRFFGEKKAMAATDQGFHSLALFRPGRQKSPPAGGS